MAENIAWYLTTCFDKIVTGGLIYYSKRGKGTDVLLVHGRYAPQIDSADIMLVLAASELK